MHPREIRVKATYELVGSEPGHWCERCALPSAWLIHMVLLVGERMQMESNHWCPTCRKISP